MREWSAEIRKHLEGLSLPAGREAQIVEELSHHLDDRLKELMLDGKTADDARRIALSELDDRNPLRQRLIQMQRSASDQHVPGKPARGRPLHELVQDLRFGIRMLLRSPGSAAAACVALALAIGGAIVVFSVLDAVVFRLPYDDPDRTVVLRQRDLKTGIVDEYSTPADSIDWRVRNRVFDRTAIARPFGHDHTEAGKAEDVDSWLISDEFFAILGTRPLVGRLFSQEEYAENVLTGGYVPKRPVVVLSYNFWQSRFMGSPTIVGTTIRLDNHLYAVVGVLPREFEFPDRRDLYVPFSLPQSVTNRRSAFMFSIGRLKPEVTLQQARADLERVGSELEKEYPVTNAGRGVFVSTLRDHVAGTVRPAISVMFGAVCILLIIAAVNVANLLLLRAIARQREFAIRMALGASRGRMIRQSLAESSLVVAVGGIGGVLLALWGVRVVPLLMTRQIPGIDRAGIDLRALMFALLAAFATAIVCSIPAFQMGRRGLALGMKQGQRVSPGGSREARIRRVFVIAEVSLAFTLVVGAGLLGRSFVKLINVDLGFRAADVAVVQVHLYERFPSPEAQAQFVEQVLERFVTVPGVESAGAASAAPLIADSIDVEESFAIDGRPQSAGARPFTAFHTLITPGYFDVLQIRLLRGRPLNRFDSAVSAPVVIINETMAKRYWPGGDVIGKKIITSWDEKSPISREIVGVVADLRHGGPETAPIAELFEPFAQHPFGSVALFVKTSSPAAMIPNLQQAVWTIRPDQTIAYALPLEELLAAKLGPRRAYLALVGGFATIALLLAALGVYGLISTISAQRTHEVGIRVALGARRYDVLRMIVGEGIGLAMWGLFVGLAGALVLVRFLETLLFGITTTDPVTFFTISILVIAIAFVASFIPAFRASRVDPVVALRWD